MLCIGAKGSNVMSFRLSCPPKGSWAKLPESERDRKANLLETSLDNNISVSICNHEPLDFGLCHHQVGYINTTNIDNHKEVCVLLSYRMVWTHSISIILVISSSF